jgi:hypothetical protein
MGQQVYVLMSQEGSGKNKAWRPVAVVSNPDLATQWYEYGKDVDWVPLELDDVTHISPGNLPEFAPRKTTPGEEKAVELSKKMEATIQRMQKIIDDQQGLIEKLTKGKKGSGEDVEFPCDHCDGTGFKPDSEIEIECDHCDGTGMRGGIHRSVGGQTAGKDRIPPRPVEKVKGGSQPFPPALDAQGLADYIETYATYEVDPEFVYEMFRGSHAVLKLVPIASLREGGREHNLQSKKNEDKYLKQDLKTQPPAVVEDGKVLDGNHRFRANKRRGLTHMWCYVVVNGEVPNGDTDG